MKKALMILAALLVIASGVMAVGAYEGHLVDVKAHVENALGVSTYEVDFGTVFPEEVVETAIQVGLSESFQDQQRYSTVEYELWWEPKPIEDGYVDVDDDGYFEPIYPFIELEVDGGTLEPIDETRLDDVCEGAIAIGQDDLTTQGDLCDWIHMTLDPPVFDGWYNECTDPRTPSGILSLEDGDYEIVTELIGCETNEFEAPVPHADLGNNLKIQVIKVVLDSGTNPS